MLALRSAITAWLTFMLSGIPCRCASVSRHQPAVMYQLFSESRGDYLLCAAAKCYSGNIPGDYQLMWHEGGAFLTTGNNTGSGLIRLYVYYSAAHEDCVSTTSNQPPDDTYTVKENNSFILAEQASGTVPLKLFRSPDGREYLTTASVEGAELAANKSYTLIETLGFIMAYPTPIENWSDPVPEGCPMEKSKAITGVSFTGRFVNPVGVTADTWFPMEGDDGLLYSSFTDGRLTDPSTGRSVAAFSGSQKGGGFAVIAGDDPSALNYTFAFGTTYEEVAPFQGRYPCAVFSRNGIWYYGTYGIYNSDAALNISCGSNAHCVDGPFIAFRYSTDRGATWHVNASLTAQNNLFGQAFDNNLRFKIMQPYWVDHGPDNCYSPDGKAYMVSYGCSTRRCGWMWGDELYLLRVDLSPETVNDVRSWEFFAGLDNASGEPRWSSELEDIQPIMSWPERLGVATVTYNAALRKYILTVGTTATAGRGDLAFDTWIAEADSVTGPFRLVTYMSDFGPQAYFANQPSKFISKSGTTAWLWYSAMWRIVQPDARTKIVNPPFCSPTFDEEGLRGGFGCYGLITAEITYKLGTEIPEVVRDDAGRMGTTHASKEDVTCDNGTSVCPTSSSCCHQQYSPTGWGCEVNGTCCLLGPAKPPSQTLPNCLVLGDSVSIGYTPHVITHLNSTCQVQHTPWDVRDGGAGSTSYGLACLEIFLKTAARQDVKWDAIHFNFGLHNLNNQSAAEDLYTQQLANITDRLLATGAKVQYGTTTPFMPDYLAGNHVVEELNQRAREIMADRKVPVVDLYGRVVQYCGPLPYKSCKICRLDPCSYHYNSDGYEYLSLPIVDGIKKLLES